MGSKNPNPRWALKVLGLKSKTRRNTLFKTAEIQPFEKVGRDLSSSRDKERRRQMRKTRRRAQRKIKIRSHCCKDLLQNNKEAGWCLLVLSPLCLWSIFTPNKDTTPLLVPPLFPLGACNFSGNMLKSLHLSFSLAGREKSRRRHIRKSSLSCAAANK